MFDDTSTDFTDDIQIASGCDLSYAFAIQPLDLTGCTASFITEFGTFSVALSVDIEGDQSVTTFATSVLRTSLPVPGLYSWKIRVTFPGSPSTVIPYGSGGLLVTE